MENKERNLLILIFTVAGIVLLVLYSPIGSPDAYNQRHYFSANQGVGFSGKIDNAPKSNKSYHDQENNLSAFTKDVVQVSYSLNTGTLAEDGNKISDPTIGSALPSYSSNKSRNVKYAVANHVDNGMQNTASYSIIQSEGVLSETNSGSSGFGNGSIFSYSSSKSSNNNSSHSSGFIAISLDMSLFGDSTRNRQTADYSPLQGGTDPGGNPIEEPIPVGDGWWILVFMAAIYASYIKLKK